MLRTTVSLLLLHLLHIWQPAHTAINHNLHVENNTLQKKLRIDYDRFLCGRTDYSKPLEFPDFMFQNLPHNIENLNLCPLGIERGLTGLALKNILQ